MYRKTIESFKAYYEGYLKQTHNNPWLIGLWGVDPGRFETQILCHSNGTPVEGTNRFEDLETGESWGPLRWPRNSYSEPEAFDPPLTYIIDRRVKAIGTTWWDWRAKQTIRLGFDIDSVLGHAPGVGVDDATIDRFSRLDLPFLTIIRSTRGLGRHLYIEFGDPFPITENHHEHAAIARSLLPMLSRMSGLDFEADKDVCGGVMWIHHANATPENHGYEMVKKATSVLTAHDISPNWRDHLSVVQGHRAKVAVRGYTAEGELTSGDELDEMSKAKARIELDETHERILDALEDTGYSVMWVHDHHLCQTHTKALEEVHERLGLRGVFATDAPGDDPGKPNCFMRPRLNGGWDVYRFGEGTTEHESWDMVGHWTHTTYNVNPSFDKVMKAAGGVPHVNEKLGYVFSDLAAFKEALNMLGVKIDLPSRAEDSRILSIKQRPDGKPIISIEKKREDKPVDFKGFSKTAQGWQKIVDPKIKLDDQSSMEDVLSQMDADVRALKKRSYNDSASRGGAFIGWVLRDNTGTWVEQPAENVSSMLKKLGYPDIDLMKGEALYNAWLLVNEPFKPEFPGGRKWNRDAPQLRYAPAKLDIDEAPKHDWWDKYLNHLGSDLDSYIKDLPWAEEWNIRNGGDYLKAWIACMIRYPFDKLPYLFMWGPQENGKSMFYESIRLLITNGVHAADKALTSQGGYNGELLNCVLAYIDETNVAVGGNEIYNRLKAWVTGLTMTIHPKYQQVFEALNTCHFVQLANELEALPVFRGDKRITAMQVPPIIEPIPKDIFLHHLEEEAPHFIYTLLNWDIPDARSRLRLPIIETSSKTMAIEMNESSLHNFIADNCYEIPGARVKLDDFYLKFIESMSEVEQGQWNKRLVKRELNDHFPIGRGPGNVDYIGNLTFNQDHEEGEAFVIVGRRLTQKGDTDDSSEDE